VWVKDIEYEIKKYFILTVYFRNIERILSMDNSVICIIIDM